MLLQGKESMAVNSRAMSNFFLRKENRKAAEWLTALQETLPKHENIIIRATAPAIYFF